MSRSALVRSRPKRAGDWQRGRLDAEMLRHFRRCRGARAAAARDSRAAAQEPDEEEHASWWQRAMAVTEAPGHQELFRRKGSRPKVRDRSVEDAARDIKHVSCQVDRLAVTAREGDRRLQDQSPQPGRGPGRGP